MTKVGERLEKGEELTSLAHQQEKPNAAGQIQDQRHGISRTPEQAQHGEEGLCQLSRQPRPSRVGDGRVGWGCVVDRGFADEWRGEAPADADEEEREKVVEGRWGRGRVGRQFVED